MKKKFSFKTLSYVITILFSLMIIYPLFYITSNAMKDSAAVYDIPPKQLPSPSKSLSIIVDYSDLSDLPEEEIERKIQEDHITSVISSVYELPKSSIFDVNFIGEMNGRTIYHARSHRVELDMEKDNGLFKGVSINQKTIKYEDRAINTANKLGYEFNLQGLEKTYDKSLLRGHDLNNEVEAFLTNNYELAGDFVGTVVKQNNWLLLEGFIHYFKLPSYIYSRNPVIEKFSFLAFIFNTIIVVGWAVIVQVFLCALTAFPISRLLPEKTGKLMLLFFLGSTMIPFVAIMIPQLTMFKNMGFYDNYAALLLPHLLPYGFFVYLYKGFFDNIPGSLFEAAKIDGASNAYLFFSICLPLSKPIMVVIGLQTFLANWNDFFWAWMVTENQSLWTLNVALYNISKVRSVKPNFVMGLSVMTIVPVLLMTILFSNQIKASIATTGIKG